MDAHAAPRLVLEDERRAVVTAMAPRDVGEERVCLTIGKDAGNDYVAHAEPVSRFHARIEEHCLKSCAAPV